MRVRFYVSGSNRKATVHCEAVEVSWWNFVAVELRITLQEESQELCLIIASVGTIEPLGRLKSWSSKEISITYGHSKI